MPILALFMLLGAIFSQKEELPLRKDNRLTTLSSVDKLYSVSFELFVTKHTSAEWRNIVHLTTGGNYGQLGNRIPAVWLRKGNLLYIYSSVNDNKDYVYAYDEPMIEGRWYRIEIDQVKTDEKVW